MLFLLPQDIYYYQLQKGHSHFIFVLINKEGYGGCGEGEEEDD